tara:strand:- start:722 stop:1693 length:972 start_codon:yes stop_codon:yes gene_type:complete
MASLSMQSTEIIVIGAGPAGATAAYLLARSGAKVVLTDRAAFPRKKLCGGCLAQTGFNLLGANKLASLPSLASSPIIDRIDLRSSTRSMILSVPPYRIIDRALFDRDLVHSAMKFGVRFLPETLAQVRPDYRVELTRSGQSTQTLTARVIIVADGIKGTALRKIGAFNWRIDPHARVGLGAMASALPSGCDPKVITMLHGRNGYAGIAPLNTDQTLIAAAVDPAWITIPHDGPPLIAFLRELGLCIDPNTTLSTTGGAPGLTRTRDLIENVFLLPSWSQDEDDIAFAYRIAEQSKGRVVFVNGKDLDRFVLWDYVNQRRSIIA